MKKISYIVLGWLWLSLVFAGTTPVAIVAPDATTFEVRLPGNATTGFQWSVLTYDKTLLKLNGQTYQAKKTGLMGSGGEAVFSFTCLKKTRPQSTDVVFSYRRPWEKQAVKSTKVVVVFQKNK
ncbi:MAG: protease inhibitor I42 family protein [Gammaproteobacteria bacterium]|nr:protease inhibitor I42 family protein [Gammaproteobacteria bacterium]